MNTRVKITPASWGRQLSGVIHLCVPITHHSTPTSYPGLTKAVNEWPEEEAWGICQTWAEALVPQPSYYRLSYTLGLHHSSVEEPRPPPPLLSMLSYPAGFLYP